MNYLGNLSTCAGTAAATPPATGTERDTYTHPHTHTFSHLSCSKDFKCIEGLWERASLPPGKEKQAEGPALPTPQALGPLCKAKSLAEPRTPSRGCMAWGAPRRHPGCREVCGCPPPIPQNPPGTREQRQGHWNRESKCL